jgi:hypothetical protein
MFGRDQEEWPGDTAVKRAMSEPVCNAADCHGQKDGGCGQRMQTTPIDSYEAENPPGNERRKEPVADRCR